MAPARRRCCSAPRRRGHGEGGAFFAEVMLGFLLVVVVLATATDDRATPAGSGLASGPIMAAGVFVTQNISGGSSNAARTLEPMIAPTLGGLVGAFCYDYLARSGAPPE